MRSHKERLLGCLPQTPQGVSCAVQRAFQQIHQEAASNPPPRYARRLSFGAVALIVLLITAMGVAAGIHFGVFDFMARRFGQSNVLPQAAEFIQNDLAVLETEHTVITLTQAVYDGGNLRIVYSIQQKDADSPIVQDDLEIETSDFRKQLAVDGVSMRGCDWFYLNGMEYSMTNGSYVDSIPGVEKGQALCYMDIYLASANILPQEDFQVGLPVIRHGRNDYERLNFTVKANAASSVLPTLHKNGAVITVLSSSLSPVRAYVNLQIEMDAEATE
ncbi:MAG: hypothetical protein RR505_12530, partial [Raoultibacter sp.]